MIKYEDYAFFESHVLPVICLFGVMALIAYGAWASRELRIAAVRQDAFVEASAALTSLAGIAHRATVVHARDGNADASNEARRRAYYYDRAAMIVRSIPSERA
jgi:hypothetical protein